MANRRKPAPKRARVRAGKKGAEWTVLYTKSRRRVANTPLYGQGRLAREPAQVAARRHNTR
jgi:hypothetical protein